MRGISATAGAITPCDPLARKVLLSDARMPLDGYVEEGVNRWDHAAGGLIARLAGARTQHFPGAAGLDLLVCAPTDGWEELLDAVLAAGFARETTGE
jgi:myo-inositol-1(or 4)-monophosphatase